MPGAPNRPPELDRTVPAEPPADQAARAVVRRLGPMRVALRLDLWKGSPSPELITPLERAEASFSNGEIATASGHLDQLAVRLAEPRWPTLPVPFKGLRVAIPAPMPPQWDPEHALPAPEKEARRLGREAELQRDLARATLDWARQHGVSLDDAQPHLDRAVGALATGPTPAFWDELDHLWQLVRARVPMPAPPRARAPGPSETPA